MPLGAPARRALTAYLECRGRFLTSTRGDRWLFPSRSAAGYLTRHPSTSPNLADLGASLPAFLRRRRESRLAESAELDSAKLRALYSTRGKPLDPEVLRDVPPQRWARLRFSFCPTLTLLPGERRWTAVYRDGSWVRTLSVSSEEGRLLQALLSGKTLGQACRDAAPPLDRWLRRGWLTGWK